MSKIIAGEDMVAGDVVELGGDIFMGADGEITGTALRCSERSPRPLGCLARDVKKGETVELVTKSEGSFRVDKLPGLDAPIKTDGLPQPSEWPGKGYVPSNTSVPLKTLLEIREAHRAMSEPIPDDDGPEQIGWPGEYEEETD